MNQIETWLIIVGVMLFVYIIIFSSIMVFSKQKNKCKHLWKLKDVQNWNNSIYGEFKKYIQECTKCGEIKIIQG